MKIAAGVLLILAALLDLMAGFTYLSGGALTSGLADIGSQIASSPMSADVSTESKAVVQTALSAGSMMGGGLSLFGIYLLACTGILIAGAVFLFQGKKTVFIFVAAAMAIVAEVIGINITSFGYTNIIGLAGGALAIVAAIGINKSIVATA